MVSSSRVTFTVYTNYSTSTVSELSTRFSTLHRWTFLHFYTVLSTVNKLSVLRTFSTSSTLFYKLDSSCKSRSFLQVSQFHRWTFLHFHIVSTQSINTGYFTEGIFRIKMVCWPLGLERDLEGGLMVRACAKQISLTNGLTNFSVERGSIIVPLVHNMRK